ncbi:Wzz/FepE/Etk N-terminal domain-containing protein [Aminobacter sp. AP02]|uniref:GumC family protein n=1 Tax=Aminobacter sp. AP02 TaxID=2135737 RepID=UPI000D6AAF0A|nr:Wzz/FepE/Etk N-terminal domain-containing protein [Aminobacter sp. AP02]PWK76864.1 polysaccharide chain length determinant protein (PEP-CTERM system associated) [Aminobacter sp. AP02]
MGDIDIRFYLSILLRRSPYFLAIVATVSALGIAIAYNLPPVYRASAKIMVETPQIPADLARSTVSTSSAEQMQVMEQQIMTREYLLALAEQLNVYGAKKSELSSSDIVDNMRSRTLFNEAEASRDGKGAMLFDVSFDAREPALAAKVVNELVSFILSKNQRLRTDSAGETMQFFDQEVARLGAELTGLESKILKFKNENKNALPDGLDFRRSQQSSQQERLLLLEREESGLRNRRNNLVQMYESNGQMITTGPVTIEQQMLQDLNRSLSEQLAIFSESSPNIVTLRSRIAALQGKSKQAEAGAVGIKKTGPTELDLQLSDIDERLRFIAQEKTYIKKNLVDLNQSISATPGNETQLNALERTRANIQGQYNNAIARQAEASTGEQIEIRSKGGRFTVVEPAIAPQKPVSPNRRRIVGASLAAGIGLGMGLIVLLELLNKSIRRPVELAQLLQVQPLATVPYIWVDGEKRTRNKRLAFMFVATASVIPAFLLGIHHYYMPIGTFFEKFVVALDSSRMM